MGKKEDRRENKKREVSHAAAPQYLSSSLWCHQESNRGHKDFQSFALPTELWYHCFLIAFAKVMLFYLSAKLFANNLFNVLKKSVSLWYNWGFVAQFYFFFSLIGM